MNTGIFEPVGLATDMVPLTGMEVNLGATTPDLLATAERVTMAAALDEAPDGHGLTRTVELAALDELLCRQVRKGIHNRSAHFRLAGQEWTYAAVGIIAAAAGAEPEALDTGAAELLAVTGQTVVETAMVLVTTMVE